MREEHQVFQTRVDARLGCRVDVRARVRKKVEELNEATDSQGFKFLRFQERLSEVDVFNNLESDQLSDMHGVRTLSRACFS